MAKFPKGRFKLEPCSPVNHSTTASTSVVMERRSFRLPKRQPLTGAFCGTEHLGMYMGHGPKGVGAVCNPTDFSGVVEVAPGVLGPRHGNVIVDLVEPGCEPMSFFNPIIRQEVFRDILPWIVIRISS
jgi:hypothetical protein